ncbi:MAG: IS110 family transposase [Thermoleophilia bacterium]
MLAVGVDTHKESVAVCVVDELGRLVDEKTFRNDPIGHLACLTWLKGLPGPRRVGVEGSAHLGAAFSRTLDQQGEQVYEVPAVRTNRERRRTNRPGKSDAKDALAIARVVAREEGLPPAHLWSENTEALRLLTDYRDELVAEAGRLRNRLHADLCVLVPGYKAQGIRLLSAIGRQRALAAVAAHPSVRSELVSKRLGQLETLEAEMKELEARIEQLVADSATALTTIPGVGPLTAARILGRVGSIVRFRSPAAFAMACGVAPIPASSGYTRRYRLNRGGDRQLNRALHTIALVQSRSYPQAQAYIARKRGEGKSTREAVRCLKRHLADVIYKAMQTPLERPLTI